MLHSIVTGLLVHGLYLGGVFVSIENGLSAGVISLVVSLQPVLTSTVANRWFGEQVRPRQWLGLILGLIGVYLILRDKATTGDATPLAWIASVVALFGITVGTLYQKRFGGKFDWRPAMCIQYAASAVPVHDPARRCLKPAPCIGRRRSSSRSPGWSSFCRFGGVGLLYFLIRRSAATRVVSLFYLTPPLTALMAWALFGEKLAALALAGMAVCVAGVFLVIWQPRGAAV